MRALDRKTFRSSSRQIDVVVASITQLGERVDAIARSDDNRLSHGGGVSEAIWKAAGPELTRFVARAQPPLRLGQVFVSPAGNPVRVDPILVPAGDLARPEAGRVR
jgi:O-acetyl-ADP-ribose deacetylase (regulator of RNase III)